VKHIKTKFYLYGRPRCTAAVKGSGSIRLGFRPTRDRQFSRLPPARLSTHLEMRSSPSGSQP